MTCTFRHGHQVVRVPAHSILRNLAMSHDGQLGAFTMILTERIAGCPRLMIRRVNNIQNILLNRCESKCTASVTSAKTPSFVAASLSFLAYLGFLVGLCAVMHETQILRSSDLGA